MEDLASVIWGELKRYINTVDREEAAENFVSILIDNDMDPENIKAAFKSDSDIKHALSAYVDVEEEEQEEDDDEEDEDYDEDGWE